MRINNQQFRQEGGARPRFEALSAVFLIIFSTVIGVGVVWRAPALELYSRDWLMRWRGSLPPPEGVILVAIDESSIDRFGRFPWSRSLMGQALDKISAGKPAAIALDVLFTDQTNQADDQALADAITRAGNVVVAAQLTESDQRSVWLKPFPVLEKSAAGVGHVNVATGFDGVARVLNLRQADDEGQARWAMAIEAVRVAEHIPAGGVQASPTAVTIGRREIAINAALPGLLLRTQKEGSLIETLPPANLLFDYVGPAGSFADRTFSIAEVIDGAVPVEAFRNKYVLIGATAAGLGDRLASPFVHEEFADGRQHGELTPGVEILANTIHAILQSRYYREAPEWVAALCAMFAAAIATVMIGSSFGRYETFKQLAAISALITGIFLGSYYTFVFGLIAPPLASTLAACLTAAPLAWLRRLLLVNADLDFRIAELAQTGAALAPFSENNHFTLAATPAALIAKIADAEAAFLFEAHTGKFRLLGGSTARMRPVIPEWATAARRSVAQALAEAEPAGRRFIFDDEQTTDFIQQTRSIAINLGVKGTRDGILLLAYSSLRPPSQETLILCREIADEYLNSSERLESGPGAERIETPAAWRPSHGNRWKARALGVLHRRLISRARFVERALHSVDDGLLVASPDGRIVFANPRSAEIFGQSARLLIGSDLFERVVEGASEESRRQSMREILTRLILERIPVERELTVGDAPARHYILRLSIVNDEQGGVLGIVASFSDITKQRELQQTKNDVMALVSHEMKTPLTAIQGMSEVLSKFDVDQERGRKMHLAIYEEAQRLRRMIDEYLDITRLESGARHLRLEPARPAQILERALMMLDPLAARREIRIVRRIAPNLPSLLLDADLIARAVTNLVSNALKFSPQGSEIIVDVHLDAEYMQIEVADRGCGIPAESLSRIFEKFYRVPRLTHDDVPGTGLGLSLVREIAELHNGRVAVESEVGLGSVFALRLPLTSERSQPPYAAAAPETQRSREHDEDSTNPNRR